MGVKFLIRADDLFVGADFAIWDAFIALCKSHDIRPIIGLIPYCEDKNLRGFTSGKSVSLEDIKKWEKDVDYLVHGTYHKYHQISRDFLKRSKKSEYAGLPLSVQRELISRSVSWFKENNIRYKGFMAPSHSFDLNTLHVLVDLNLNMISDGYGIYGYRYRNCLFIPQLFSTSKNFGFGYYTICFHPLTTSYGSILSELNLASKKGDFINLRDFKVSNTFHYFSLLLIIPVRLYRYVQKY